MGAALMSIKKNSTRSGGVFCLIKLKKNIFISMRIKDEWIDRVISHPMTGKPVWIRELDTRLWPMLKSKGFEHIFGDEVETFDEMASTKKDKKK